MAMCCDVASNHATRWIVRALGNRSSVPWLPGADGKPRPTELDMRWVGTLGPWQALRESANWFDPIEAGLRDRAREFLQAMLEAELDEVLDRSRYARRAKRSSGDSEATAGATPRRRTQSSLVSGLPRWSAPLMVDSFQAAFLTGCWAWRSSYCAGLR